MEDKTKIELDKAEADLFLNMFRRNQEIWETARKLAPGSLVIHFDKDFNIRKHEFHFYKKK